MTRARALLPHAVATVAMVALSLCATCGADEIKWYDRAEDALAAAKQSGKSVFVYIYSDKLQACKAMRTTTLNNLQVVALLKAFECCALNAELPANAAFVDKYTTAKGEANISPNGTTESADDKRHPEIRMLVNNAHVFLDSQGRELYVGWGFVTYVDFLVILQQMPRMAELTDQIARDPENPRVNADLGHVLLQLELYAEGKMRLQRAAAADPDNKAGAKEDATLDLIVLGIPDNPAKGYDALVQFLKDYPKTVRELEARYFEAVALAAQGAMLDSAPATKDPRAAEAKYREALKIASSFEVAQGDRMRPVYDKSLWTEPALSLKIALEERLASRATGPAAGKN
jgi:tetratricopeptide (TPR) repeat protein